MESAHFCEACGKPLTTVAKTPSLIKCNCPPGKSQPDVDGYCEVCGIRCTIETNTVQFIECIDDKLTVISDIGKNSRHDNEDAGTVARGENDITVLVVADGVSSSVNSTLASTTAVKTIRDMLVTCNDPDLAPEIMKKAIESAHTAIISIPDSNGKTDTDGPETTVVAAWKQKDQLVVGWVGDSRAYLVDNESDELLTLDDSWIEEAVKSGEFTREQASKHKNAHAVTQVIGMKDDVVDIHVSQITITKEALILLCTDGLWNYFQTKGDLSKIMVENCLDSDATSLCKNLVQQANNKGGHDNITVAISM